MTESNRFRPSARPPDRAFREKPTGMGRSHTEDTEATEELIAVLCGLCVLCVRPSVGRVYEATEPVGAVARFRKASARSSTARLPGKRRRRQASSYVAQRYASASWLMVTASVLDSARK